MDRGLLRDIFQWDVGNWSSALKKWEKILKSNQIQNAVAFGEREGGLSLWLAIRNINVICTDFNDFPEELPLSIHKKYGVDQVITYDKQDITAISYEDNQFDLVIFKSVVGSLGSFEQQERAFNEIHRILKPGGFLLFAENTSATKVHQFARKKFTGWGNNWYYPSQKEIIKALSRFKSFEYESKGFLAVFGRSESQRNILSKIDKVFIKVTPSRWRYILFGIAQK